MALTLYHAHNSYASQKVRLHLAENNINWDSHPIDLLKQEHINDEYIKINPRGLVPALVDNGKIILNSTDIMQYIDDHYANEFVEKTLAKEIYDFCKLDEKLHDPHIRTLSYHYLWMKEEKSLKEVNKVLALAEKHPDKARGNFLAKAILRKITEEEITLAKKEIIMALEQMEKRLQNSKADFLFGDKYTMTDAVGVVRLFRLQSLNFEIKQYPLLLAYYKRMMQRSSFNKAQLI